MSDEEEEERRRRNAELASRGLLRRMLDAIAAAWRWATGQ